MNEVLIKSLFARSLIHDILLCRAIIRTNDYNSVLHKIIIFAVDSNQTILSNSIH